MTKRKRHEAEGIGRSRMRFIDVVETATLGTRSRKGRTLLTALGIAIGIAALLAVVGISASSKAEIVAQIEGLGTNLLQVRPGDDVFGEDATLPPEASAMVRRIEPVESATSLIALRATVRTSPFVPRDEPSGVDLLAAEANLLATLEGKMASGRFFDGGMEDLPVVVLGAVAAERLGITSVEGGRNLLIAGQWFNVIGILETLPLNPDVDRAAIIGENVAVTMFDIERNPTAIYLRTTPEQVESVRAILARTANPAAPNEVSVSRPSDVLEARAQVDEGLQTLLLGLGSVALLVGAIGIANVMVIGVLERRTEIGVRRALGATRTNIGMQFVVESAFLALIGGVLGIAIGTTVTYVYARSQQWTSSIPIAGLAAAIGATLVLGVVAGLYPAIRAARLDPVEAIRPTG